MTVHVYDTDYSLDDATEFVVNSTVNGDYLLHGACSPRLGAPMRGDGYFRCANVFPLPLVLDGVYAFETSATPSVGNIEDRRRLQEEDAACLKVEYMVSATRPTAPTAAAPAARRCRTRRPIRRRRRRRRVCPAARRPTSPTLPPTSTACRWPSSSSRT